MHMVCTTSARINYHFNANMVYIKCTTSVRIYYHFNANMVHIKGTTSVRIYFHFNANMVPIKCTTSVRIYYHFNANLVHTKCTTSVRMYYHLMQKYGAHQVCNKCTLCTLKFSWADPEGGGGVLDPLKNHKNIGFLCNTGPNTLKNHKATKPAFHFGPSSARKRNTI